jgi:Cu(I)/Ag(I) efflux system membrane fusion protein
MNNKVITFLLLAGLAILGAAAGGYWLGTRGTVDGPVTAGSGTDERQPLFYRHPMNPEITSDVLMQDQMGMDYIPVYADDAQNTGPAGTVQIDPVTVQTIGVRTAKVERRAMAQTIKTVGRIDYDEQRLVQLHPKTEGWIEEMFVEKTGEPVRVNSILLSLYSPQLVSTQQEFVLALKNLETLRASPFEDVRTGAEELVQTTEDRLRLFDVPDHQIDELKATLTIRKNLHIHSPAEGIVIKIGAREGQYVTPQTELYAIADLSRVWVLVDIYEDELPWIRVGDQARMSISAVPGRTFTGTLAYIYPYAESRTRTVKVRMEFDNPDLLLKPDMFADVTIEADAIEDTIAVPSEAIIRSGTRQQVFIQRAPGKFEPREVTLGVSSDGWTQVRDGIEAGEEVVVSAQFLIDSESKLREAAAKMREAR